MQCSSHRPCQLFGMDYFQAMACSSSRLPSCLRPQKSSTAMRGHMLPRRASSTTRPSFPGYSSSGRSPLSFWIMLQQPSWWDSHWRFSCKFGDRRSTPHDFWWMCKVLRRSQERRCMQNRPRIQMLRMNFCLFKCCNNLPWWGFHDRQDSYIHFWQTWGWAIWCVAAHRLLAWMACMEVSPLPGSHPHFLSDDYRHPVSTSSQASREVCTCCCWQSNPRSQWQDCLADCWFTFISLSRKNGSVWTWLAGLLIVMVLIERAYITFPKWLLEWHSFDV